MGTAFCVVQTRTMKTFVALALFVAAASAYTTTLQDRIVLYPHMMAKNPARGSGRIVGGQEAVPNSYPHLVFLLIDSLYVCGGNIFNENTIITAAHCADGANRIQITAGAHDQTQNEPSQQVVISTSHIEHPDWNSFTLSVMSPSSTSTRHSPSPPRSTPSPWPRLSPLSAMT